MQCLLVDDDPDDQELFEDIFKSLLIIKKEGKRVEEEVTGS